VWDSKPTLQNASLIVTQRILSSHSLSLLVLLILRANVCQTLHS